MDVLLRSTGRMGSRARSAGAVLALAAGLACAAGAAERPSMELPLGGCVPSDSLLYVHLRLDGAAAETRRAWVDGLRGLVIEEALPGGGSGEEKRRAEWERLLGSVPWDDLVAREAALAVRVAGERREFLLLFRVFPERRDALFAGLRRLIFAACSLSPSFEISESSHGDETIVVLLDISVGETLCVAAVGDLVVLSTSPGTLRRALQLRRGTSSDLGFHYGRERAEALADLPVDGGEDPDLLELHLRPAEIAPDVPALAGLRSVVLRLRRHGAELRYGFRIQFAAPGGEDADLARRALLERPGIPRWAELVPASADSFAVSAGAEPRALLDLLRKLVLELLPEGQRRALQWGLLDDPGEGRTGALSDLAAILTGRRVLVGTGSATAALFDLSAGVDPGRLREVLSVLRERLLEVGLAPEPLTLDGIDGSFLVARPRDGAAPGLVVGFAADALVVATSPDVIREAILVRGGKAPSREGVPLPSELPEAPGGTLLALGRTAPPAIVGIVRLLGAGRSKGGGGGARAGGLQPLLERALSSLRAHAWRVARDGDSLRGAGTIRLEEAERRF